MTQNSVSEVLRQAQRIVIKVGSSLVTNEGRGLDETAIGEWCRQMARLAGQADLPREVVMVSSGAIAEGMKRLGWTQRPSEVNELQAAAAVGQMGLAQMYETKLREQGLRSAQVLLTHADLADRERYLNARSTLLTLLEHRVLPVINENDTVVTDEIKVGDNDTLGALVANLIEADLLVILTDQKGLYTADPRANPQAEFVHEARAGDPDLERMAGGAGSSIGKGGMLTKILAAKRAARSGASTVIAWGREPDVLLRLSRGVFEVVATGGDGMLYPCDDRFCSDPVIPFGAHNTLWFEVNFVFNSGPTNRNAVGLLFPVNATMLFCTDPCARFIQMPISIACVLQLFVL